MTPSQLGAYSVVAYNTAKDSENKIHDDAVASRFGFSGGLVPGVDVYAYMTHLPVQRWGRAWLEHGRADCRFVKPVYDGETAEVTAVESADGFEIAVTSRGEVCAVGHASLPADASTPPALDSFPQAAPPAERPPADEASLAPGTWLGIRPFLLTADFAAQYLRDVRETSALYDEERIAHPGLMTRSCNWALIQNVVLGPWIHVGNVVRNFAAARVGETLSVRARVSGNFERKGNRFVELDALVLADEARVVARITHTAIYRPRQVAAAAE